MDMIDPQPRPVSDPEAIGLPETADDDSHADSERDFGRVADGMDPAALPGERDEGPWAVEDFGTTPGERRRGESLDGKLAREMPGVTPSAIQIDPNPVLAEDLDPDASDQLAFDTELLAVRPDAVSPAGAVQGNPGDDLEPGTASHISIYDRFVPEVPSLGTVGHLVRLGTDGYSSIDADETAFDAGVSGGGFSEEEAAMHEVPPDVLDAQAGESEPYVTDFDRGDAREQRPAAPYDEEAVRQRVIRTGSDQAWDPEDLAVAEGRDPTPGNVERAQHELDRLGAAAIERTVP